MKRFFAGTCLILQLSGFLFLQSCGDRQRSDDGITNTSNSGNSDTLGAEKAEKIQEIFYSIPSPMEMATLLKRAGASYEVNVLSDVKRVNDYTSARSQALNLGIYGADLSYASIFNQNQESIIYLSCIKKLADKLGVSKAFDESAIERMEMNLENRDSLLNIISETYFMLDAYLKENGRDHISAMIIAAGWIEGLYLSTTIASKPGNADPGLIQRIAEQKLSLDNLQELVKAYNSSGQLDEILADLNNIESAYADVIVTKGIASVTKAEDGTTVIGGNPPAQMSKTKLAEISKVVSEIRTKYTS